MGAQRALTRHNGANKLFLDEAANPDSRLPLGRDAILNNLEERGPVFADLLHRESLQ